MGDWAPRHRPVRFAALTTPCVHCITDPARFSRVPGPGSRVPHRPVRFAALTTPYVYCIPDPARFSRVPTYPERLQPP
jgi:hypothetical protein